MQSAASHLSRSACRKCHIEETAPPPPPPPHKLCRAEGFYLSYFFIFVHKKLIPAAYSHYHRSICSFLPFNKIEPQLMMCCLLVHDELVNGPFLNFFLVVNPAFFFLFFPGLCSAVGCSLICRLDSIELNLWLIIYRVIKVCIGGGGRREECNLQSTLHYLQLFFYSFTVLRSRTRCLTTGVKLFNMYNTCKSRRGGYCFIKRAMPGRVRLNFLLASSRSFLSRTHMEVRPTDLKADAATNMSGFNLLINYSKCRYWTLNFTTFQTFFFFFFPRRRKQKFILWDKLESDRSAPTVGVFFSLHQRWCTDFTPTLSGSCFWRYLSPKNLVFIKHAGKSFYIWVSARWKEKKRLDLIGDEHDGNFVSLVFFGGCKK